MLQFTIRRTILAVPTLLFISLVIFLLLELAPGDPMAQVPLTVPPEVKEKMRLALGLGEPVHVRFWKWIVQFFLDRATGFDRPHFWYHVFRRQTARDFVANS